MSSRINCIATRVNPVDNHGNAWHALSGGRRTSRINDGDMMYPHEFIGKEHGAQRRFAEKAKIPYSTVSRVYRGLRWPSLAVARAFVRHSGGAIDKFIIPAAAKRASGKRAKHR